jgi:hypothetical protein
MDLAVLEERGANARSHMPGIIAALEKDDREWIGSQYLGCLCLARNRLTDGRAAGEAFALRTEAARIL